MHAGADPSLVQLHDELVATDVEDVQVQPERVEVPRMPAIFLDWREVPVPQCRRAPGCKPPLAECELDETLQLSELMIQSQTECPEVVLEAERRTS